MSRRSRSMFDRYITIFSPEGRLYQVEYALKAIENCNITAIALKGPTTACLVSQRKVPLQQAEQDKMLDMSSVKSLHTIIEHIGCAMVGLPGDCSSMVFRARDIAFENGHKLGHDIPVQYLAQKVANLNQVYAQHAYMRLHACCGIFIGIDEDRKTPEIYRFDPAGWYAGYKACAIGNKEQGAVSSLEKIVKIKSLDTEKNVIEESIGCLQSVLSSDFKADEIEVGIVTLDNPTFRILSEAEVEQYLTWLAERD